MKAELKGPSSVEEWIKAIYSTAKQTGMPASEIAQFQFRILPGSSGEIMGKKAGLIVRARTLIEQNPPRERPWNKQK